MTGVSETRGGAALGWLTFRGCGRSGTTLGDAFETEWGIDGRLASMLVITGARAWLVSGGLRVVPTAAAAAAESGAEKVFLTLESRDETIAYEDWSFSSSSSNGLKEVRLVTSSSFELLRDLDDAALPNGGCGDIGCGDSIIIVYCL